MTWVRKSLPAADKPHVCPLPGFWRRLFAGARVGARWRCGTLRSRAPQPGEHLVGGCGKLWEWQPKGWWDAETYHWAELSEN